MRKQREITRLTLHRGDGSPLFLAAIDSHEDSQDDIQLMIRRNFKADALVDGQDKSTMTPKNMDKLLEQVILTAVSVYSSSQKLLGLKPDHPLTSEMPIETKFLPAQSYVRAERRLQP